MKILSAHFSLNLRSFTLLATWGQCCELCRYISAHFLNLIKICKISFSDLFSVELKKKKTVNKKKTLNPGFGCVFKRLFVSTIAQWTNNPLNNETQDQRFFYTSSHVHCLSVS